ncbi:MAG: beta-ketoacyl-[acyl-carrier-protein] synthase family protein [Limisphaerales bacterium]
MSGLTQRRVVITGIGVVAACGHDLDTFWNSVVEGSSGVAEVTRFDPGDLPTRLACEIKDLNVGQFIDPKRAKRFERSIRHGLVAAKMAVEDAGVTHLNSDRVAITEGASVGGLESSFKAQAAFENKGYRSMSPFTLINSYAGSGSAEVAIEFGIEGTVLTIGSGSCSSTDAIGQGRSLILQDEADTVLAGGSEAPLLGPVFGSFCLAKAMSATAMRPFDRDRDGFILGEGAAYVVLEEASVAVARGAKVYAELAGYGSICEAHNSVTPQPDGIGMSRAIRKALRQAKMDAADLQYINLHGTASDTHDPAETNGIKLALGPQAKQLSASATKPITGYTLGASGAVETAVTALAIDRQVIPPTINHDEPAEGCDLDYVPNEARPYPLTTAISVNAGFGGRNSCLAFRRFEA